MLHRLTTEQCTFPSLDLPSGELEQIFMHHWIPFIAANRMMYNMTLLGQIVKMTWPRPRSGSQSDLVWSCCISIDSPWQYKHNASKMGALSQFSEKLLAKQSLSAPVTWYDLWEVRCSKTQLYGQDRGQNGQFEDFQPYLSSISWKRVHSIFHHRHNGVTKKLTLP